MLANLFVLLQYVLPKHWITGVIWRVARIRNPGIKNYLITRFVRLYNVNIDEVLLNVPEDFATFNEFFIRELEPDARRIDNAVDTIVSPVDGIVSIAAPIMSDSIIQAKGI